MPNAQCREFAMPTEPHLFATPSPVYATRRDFLRLTGSGFGMLALTGLLEQMGLPSAKAAEAAIALPSHAPLNPLAAHPAQFPAKAKHVIWLFMNGGPS